MTPLAKKLWRDLWRTRGPALTIAMVTSLGICGLTAFLGLHRGLVDSRDRYYQSHQYADFHLSLRRAPRSVLDRVAALPGVEALEGRISARVSLALPGVTRRLAGRFLSLPEHGPPRVNRLLLKEGRLPASGGAREIVLIEDLAKARGIRPGDRIELVAGEAQWEVEVTGIAWSPEFVYVIPEDGAYVPDPDNFGVVWARTRFAEQITDMAGSFDDLVGRVGRGSDGTAMAEQLEHVLADHGVLLARDRDDMPPYALLQNEIDLTLVRAKTIPTIFLLASALVLNLVLTRLIAAQRVQIGTMKALGISSAAIVLHYVGYALVVAFLGAVGGTALGYYLCGLLTRIYVRFYHLPDLDPAVYPDIVAGAVLLALTAGLLGILQACTAVLRLTPAEAMRPAPPELRSQGVVVHLKRLPLLWRIAMRHVVRNPFRTAVTCLGITIGVGIMITSRFFTEGITGVNMFRFRILQRQDVELTLREDSSDRAALELRRLPGVDLVERTYQHPFEVRKGRYARKIVVEAYEADAWLQRPRSRDGFPIPLPAVGVLLADKLAEILGVEEGDMVELHSLRGRQRTYRVPVAGTYPSYIGLHAAARLGWLRDLVDEPRAVSALKVLAAGEARPLEDALARRPGVLRINRRSEKVKAFQESVQGTLDAATRILVTLAGMIACGLMLNGVLVSLAERRRELAVLRVQGFRRGEIATMLLYEHFLTGLLGMIAGVPMGFALTAWVHSNIDSEVIRLPYVISRQNIAAALLYSTLYMILAHLAVRGILRGMHWRADLSVKE